MKKKAKSAKKSYRQLVEEIRVLKNQINGLEFNERMANNEIGMLNGTRDALIQAIKDIGFVHERDLREKVVDIISEGGADNW